MSITARTVIGPELREQILKLERSPQILDKHFRSAIKGAVDMTYQAILPNIPQRTGKAAGSFRRQVFGFGAYLEGKVGWWGDDVDAWYINIVEHGARKHSLAPTGRSGSVKQRASREKKLDKTLARGGSVQGAHVMINGNWVTMKVHGGFSARRFMAAGYSAIKPLAIKEYERAAERALAEQAVR